MSSSSPFQPLDQASQEQVFLTARSYRYWQPAEISEAQIKTLYDLYKMGPTASNSQPGRFVWVKSPAAKEKLAACATGSNPEKIRAASVTVIIAADTKYYDYLPELTHDGGQLKAELIASPAGAAEARFRNSSLQGAYLMMAARMLGYDCGPMSGFDAVAINREFFPDGRWRVNFLCNLGKGEPSRLHPREPRLDFDQANKII